MNINEHDKKEIKGCIKLKEELEKTIGEDLSERITKMEKVYVELVRKKDKEIERLNNELQDFKVQDISNQEQLYNLIEENERLNNIINETKKILLLNFDTSTTIFKALIKLNELKENK